MSLHSIYFSTVAGRETAKGPNYDLQFMEHCGFTIRPSFETELLHQGTVAKTTCVLAEGPPSPETPSEHK
jgi:hypothetical protein